MSPGQSNDSRSAAVRKAIRSYLHERDQDDAVSEEQLLTRHADLMPELAKEMYKLRIIDEGRRLAGSASTFSCFCPTSDGWNSNIVNIVEVPSIPGYELLRRVHRGGQGMIYEAIQKTTQRRVAIKVLRERMIRGPHDKIRFEREVQVLGALSHPHIVTIHDSGTVAGQFYFVMDFIHGHPLDVYMASERRSVTDTLHLFAAICEAVHAAHLRGVIHRDLKPSNILIDEQGGPFILDFGLAKIAEESEVETGFSRTVTEPGQFVGSLPWASPEQVDGLENRIDLRTDVYSMGVILFQILTGRFPYAVVGNMRDVMNHILETEPIRPSRLRKEINSEVEAIVLKCLNKDPIRRYQSAGDLALDIRRYLSGEPVEAKQDSTWYILRKKVYRHRVAVGFGCILVLVLVLFGVWMSLLYHRESRIAQENRLLADCMQEVFRSERLSELPTSPFDMLDQRAQVVEARLKGNPRILTKVLETVCDTHMRFHAPERAVPWAKKVTELHRSTLKSDPHTLARRLATLADIHKQNGDHVEAEECYQEAISLLRSNVPGPDELLAGLLNQYGDFLGYRKGDMEAGLALRQQSLEIARQIYAEDDDRLRSPVFALAMYLHDMARFSEAEAVYLKSLDHAERRADEPAVWGARYWLGLLYKDMGKYESAKPYMRGALDYYRKMLGELNSTTLGGYLGLAKLLNDAEELVEAEDVCRTALERYVTYYGKDHELTSEVTTLLGQILLKSNRFQEAEPILRQSLEVREKCFPPTNWERAKTATLLGHALAGLGRFEEAESLLVDNFPFILVNRGITHRRTEEALARLMFLYDCWASASKR